jgi:hypothetical protein
VISSEPTGAATSPARGRTRPLLRVITRNPNAAMALWGLICSIIAALVLLRLSPTAWPMNDSRGVRLRDAMFVLNHGGPLLLGRHGPGAHLYAVDFGDDEGAFVYVPLLSRLFGGVDPVSMVRDLYVALVSLTVALYPTLFHRLTRSSPAGLAAPLFLVICILSMGFIDLYWIPAWGALTLLPMLYLLARDRPRYGLAAIAAVALGAGWLSSIRSYSGLGIFAAAAIVLLMRRWRWWRLLPALAMVTLLYLSITMFVFPVVREDRDRQLGSAAKRLDLTSGHTLWHTAYAGFGYLPNRYGLRFLDGVPNARVQREAPGTPVMSSHYEAVIREAYLHLLRDHPGEALRQYAAKAVVVSADAAPYLLIVLVTLPAALLLTAERRIVRQWCLLSVPGVIVGFLPPMLALPMREYEQDLYGVVGVLGILGLCFALKLLERAAREQRGLPWSALKKSTWSDVFTQTPGRRAARISLIAALTVIVLSCGAYFLRREADRWQGGPSGVLMERFG